jgi:hypothetical protein
VLSLLRTSLQRMGTWTAYTILKVKVLIDLNIDGDYY